MKIFVILVVFSASAMAQRPHFAGTSAKGTPELAARFRPNNSDSNAATNNVDLGNRIGVVDGTTEKLPIDARGDVNLVNRIKDWPRENWPYWLVNADTIEKQIGTSSGGNQGTNSNTQPQRGNSNGGNQGTGQRQPVNNVNQVFPRQPTTGSGHQVQNRFNGDNCQPRPENNNGNSFNVIMNNQLKTYVYDPATDAWYAKRN